jgi:hypothetical protein
MRFEILKGYMAKRNQEKRVEIEGLPKETVAAVVIAHMEQVKAIADTLSESDKVALYQASNLVLDLVAGYTTPAVVAAIPQIQAILAAK